MFLDSRSLPTGTVIETEVCIIGAGAAGITLAREFASAEFRVALLESGGMDYEPDTQALYEGQSVGEPFEELTASRLRFFGGSTNHWGGWCLPFDAIDFENRGDLPYYGWPFEKSHLDQWYERAQEVCRIGPYDYRPSSWGIPAKIIPPPFGGPYFECRILQESRVQFGPAYADELGRAPRLSVFLHANAFRIDTGEVDNEVRELRVKTLAPSEFIVRARIYILAAGGIENARLLLASGAGDRGLGNSRDLIGRFLMVHLIYSGGTIVPSDPHMNFDFRIEAEHAFGGKKQLFFSFLGLTPTGMRREHLPGVMLWWTYRFAPVQKPVAALSRLTRGEGPDGSILSDLGKVIGNLDGVATFVIRKALFGEGVPIEALDVSCASEQQPNPRSRVSLGDKLDKLGMPEVVVDWHLVPDDKSKAAATLRLLGTEVGRTGFGRMRPSMGEDGPWPPDFYGNGHHTGTTRMHKDPALGVVNENCRLHAVANLYVAGSSVFPTGSANNPTLTIVALALRLADHIKQQLKWH
jgi:choline dehydrogenase-like flavoprotein